MFVLLLIAYIASAAGLVVGGYIAATGRVPRLLIRPSEALSDRVRIRFQGFALSAVALFTLVCAMAADAVVRHTVRPSWGVLVWVGFVIALPSIAFLSRRGPSRWFRRFAR